MNVYQWLCSGVICIFLKNDMYTSTVLSFFFIFYKKKCIKYKILPFIGYNAGFSIVLITSCCLGDEPMLLPRTDSWTHEFAIVNYYQSDRCLLKSRQHKFIFQEQISNDGCKGVV